MWSLIAFTACFSILCVDAQRNYFAQANGLTDEEKQHILDVHNMLRARVALGKVKGQPRAADMVALEWDDRLMESSQGQADSCPDAQHAHDAASHRRIDPYEHVGQNYFGGVTLDHGMFNMWFKELLDYSFDSAHCSAGKICGHYQQLVWGRSHLVGCGYNDCKGRYHMDRFYCNYAVGVNGVNPKLYTKGKACSKCPAGYNFCMSGALCASKKACSNTKSKCVCNLKDGDCQNGAKFDAATCRCKCSAEFEGTKCELPCKNTRPERECKEFKETNKYCEFSSGGIFNMLKECRKACGFCGSLILPDKDEANSGGFVTNAMKVKLNLQKTLHTKPTLPPRGNCANKLPDSKCDEWARYGNCKGNPKAMRVDCPGSCNMCSTRKTGTCKNKGSDKECEKWAETGYCKNNKEWMVKNCARSCNTC